LWKTSPERYFAFLPGPIKLSTLGKFGISRHDVIGNPNLADAILDRIFRRAGPIEMPGDSMQKRKKLDPT
jgi:hypothetical protein